MFSPGCGFQASDDLKYCRKCGANLGGVREERIESILRFVVVSHFLVADLSDPQSVPAELQAIVPHFHSLPVVPIIEALQREYPAMVREG